VRSKAHKLTTFESSKFFLFYAIQVDSRVIEMEIIANYGCCLLSHAVYVCFLEYHEIKIHLTTGTAVKMCSLFIFSHVGVGMELKRALVLTV